MQTRKTLYFFFHIIAIYLEFSFFPKLTRSSEPECPNIFHTAPLTCARLVSPGPLPRNVKALTIFFLFFLTLYTVKPFLEALEKQSRLSGDHLDEKFFLEMENCEGTRALFSARRFVIDPHIQAFMPRLYFFLCYQIFFSAMKKIIIPRCELKI